jgi:hypothetical protein
MATETFNIKTEEVTKIFVAEFNHDATDRTYEMSFEDFLPEEDKKRLTNLARDLGFAVIIKRNSTS